MSDPLFDTYQAYRLSTARAPRDGPPAGGPKSGCGCLALLVGLVGSAILVSAILGGMLLRS